MFNKAIEVWFTYYRQKTGQEYIFDGMQGKHLKQLLKKVETKVKQKGMDPTEENVLNSFNGFLHHMKDPWIIEHLEISIVNSKFNILYAKAISNSPFNTRIDDIIEHRFGHGQSAGQKGGN